MVLEKLIRLLTRPKGPSEAKRGTLALSFRCDPLDPWYGELNEDDSERRQHESETDSRI